MVGMASSTSRGVGSEDYEIGELISTLSLKKADK